MVLGGIGFGIYVGVWLMFIGGIVQLIEAIRAENLVTMEVAIGVARIVFAGFIGTLSAFLLIIPGAALCNLK